MARAAGPVRELRGTYVEVPIALVRRLERSFGPRTRLDGMVVLALAELADRVEREDRARPDDGLGVGR